MTTLLASYASVLGSPAAQAAADQTSIDLTKSVSSAAFVPTLTATIAADRASALPGDDVRFTTHVTNASAVMTLSGAFHAASSAQVTGTIAAWWDEVEYNPKGSHDWVPLGGQQAMQSGYQLVVPAPATGGLQVTATPSSSGSGVTYPTGSDTVLGTRIGAGAKADWSYAARLSLSAQQVQVLSNPAAVAGVRNVVHFEVTPRDPKNGQPYTARTEFANPFAASSAAVGNVRVVTTLPDGSKVTSTSSDVAALGSLAPGASADVPVRYRVPVPAAKGTDESDQDYLARLTAVEGTALNASASVTGTAGSGASLSASAGPATVTEHLPVLTIGKSGPAQADAGSTASYDLPLANGGGATAGSLAVVDALPDGARGTVTGVPGTLAAGGGATAHASYAIPASQADGPLTDTATVTWKDGNGNAYGPVAASYQTDVRSSYAGATLSLAPVTAGPDVVGTRQPLTATLTDASGHPMPGVSLHFTVSGANSAAGNATTDAAGHAPFSYVGTGNGTDTAQATLTAAGTVLQSNTATIGWITPVQPVSTTTVDGRFFAEPAGATTFRAKPGDPAAFGQSFPSLAFNPPSGALPHDITGVNPSTRPFTDVTTDVAGNGIATIPAQGNGHRAGIGDMACFDAAFTAQLVVSQASDVTFRFQYASGFLFGVGGGATRVNGLYENVATGATTPFEGYQVVGADNTFSSSVRNGTVTVHFPSAGSYPYEVDYTGCGSQLSLVMQTVSFDADTSGLTAYVGYADGLRPAGSIFPFPWSGSPNTLFVGCQGSCQFDGGAIRLDNTTGQPVTINSLTVDFGPSCRFAIWPHDRQLPDGQSAIYTQMISGASSGCPNDGSFDTSDAPLITCTPTHITPHITFTVDGVTHSFDDASQILNTKGVDFAECPGGNESHAWSRVGGNGIEVNHPLPPAASLVLTPTTHATNSVGSFQSVQVSAMDASGEPVANLPVNLTVAGANAQHVLGTTDASGNATLTYPGLSAGDDSLQVTAFVTGMRALSNATTVTWTNPAGTVPDPTNPGQTLPAPAPVVVPQLPADGSVVTKPFPIKASFTAPDGETITSWKVTYRDLDPGPVVTLASGTGTPPDTLATFDTTLLANDTYAITVSATSSGGGVQSATSTVVVSGNLKLGRYQTTVRDLTVPIGGTQFRLDRTYDSYDKRVGDFGVGWRLKLDSFRVSANRQLGAGGWSQYAQQCFFFLCTMGFRSAAPHVVTVVWPDGHRESFDFTPDGGSNLFWFGSAKFTARPGTTSTLEVVGDTEVDYFGDGNLYDGLGGSIYDPTRFKLTARDGRTYVLDVNQGLISQTDAAGNTVTVDDSGVHATSGPSLTFVRDSAGRVTRATGIGGQTVDYGYDGNGDLVSAIDSNGQSAGYEYDAAHDLTTLRGTGGVLLRALTYGSDGRLATVTDAAGNTIAISNDVAGRQQSFTDGTGNLTTVLTMDDLGDVLREDRVADGATRTTRYTYDPLGRQLTSTDPMGRTTASTYDDAGDLLTQTDPLGHALTITYDSHGQPLTVTTARGGTATYAYDAQGRRTKMVDARGGTTTYSYDGANHVLQSVGPRGGLTSYSYDASGRLLTTSDALGGTTTYAYDAQGRTTSKVDPRGAVTRYAYDAAGDLTSLTDPLGSVTSYAYDDFLRATSRTDAEGGVTRWAYDALGNLASETDPLGHRTSYAYDADGRLIKTTAPSGAVRTRAYDGFGDIVTATDATGRITRYGYDADAEVTSRTMPGGAVWQYGFDAAGHRTSITNPLGRTRTTAYDATGLAVRSVDPAGNATRYRYDAGGDLLGRTDPLGHETSYGYDADGDLVSVTDALGDVTAYAYDAAGNRTSRTDATGRAWSYAYDPAGNVTARTDPAGHRWSLDYDLAGRVTGVVQPSSGRVTLAYDRLGRLVQETDQLGHTTSYGYDAAGRATSETDPLGAVTSSQFDADGREVKLTDALGGTVQFQYDAEGRPTRLVDPDGAVTTLGYDTAGDVVREVDPSGRTLQASYDDLGRPVSTVNGRGQEVDYAYTPAGRLASVAHPEGTDAFSYDAAGRLTGYDDATGSTTVGYDGAGRVSSVSGAGSDLRYAYDAAGRRTALTVSGVRLDYGYDTDGRLAAVTEGSSSARYGYTADGLLSSVDRGNGVSSSYGYDAAGHVTSISHTSGTTVRRLDYTVDAAGRRTSARGPGGLESYTHDALGRVTGATYADGTRVNYAYDPAGNRLSTTIGGQTTTYAYDGAGRLTTVTAPSGTATYAYDADDEVTRRGSDSFAYDSLGELTRATVGGQATTYAYDAGGSRASATSASGTTPYAYDRVGTGVPKVVSQGSEIDAWGPDGLAFDTTGGTTSYPLTDALGSVRWLTDQSGTVTGSASYDVFGAVTGSSGSSSAFGYAGELTDRTGLVDLRARAYDPSSGRFMSADSYLASGPGTGGYNRWSYSGNDPVDYTDPTGHEELIEYAETLQVAAILTAIALLSFYLIRLLQQAGTPCFVNGTCFPNPFPKDPSPDDPAPPPPGAPPAAGPDAPAVPDNPAVPDAQPAPADPNDPGNDPDDDDPCKGTGKNGGNKLPPDQIGAPPPARGRPPIGLDGYPIELHHRGQSMDSPLDEMSRTDHRLGDNFSKNHPNTGEDPSEIDRHAFDQERKQYWRDEWDRGRWNDDGPPC